MPRYVTVFRWRPETFRAMIERWRTVVRGEAPKEVLDAYGKVKTISLDISAGNCCGIHVFEVDDLKTADTLGYYMSDVIELETYPVIPLTEAWSIVETIPPEKIPKPEPWYRT